MSSEYIRIINMYNLCTFYLLPLTGLNLDSFGGRENFVNCYVDPEGTGLVVSIISPEFLLGVYDNPFYYGDLITADANTKTVTEYCLVFKLDPTWMEDFEHFCKGEYRAFSEGAKQLLRQFSGLSYKRATDLEPGTHTDLRLLALETDPERIQPAKEYWEGVTGWELDMKHEMMWPPKGIEFRDACIQ